MPINKGPIITVARHTTKNLKNQLNVMFLFIFIIQKSQKSIKCNVSFYFDICLKIIKFWVTEF